MTSLVLVARMTTDATVNVSMSVGFRDNLVLLPRGRSSCLWFDFDNSSGARCMCDVGATRNASGDGELATIDPIESLLAAVGLVVSLLFDNAHRCRDGLMSGM